MSSDYNATPRPDEFDALSIEAELRTSGFDREDASFYAQLSVQEKQSAWDQANLIPEDAYSALSGLYAVSRDKTDPDKVTLTRGVLNKGESTDASRANPEIFTADDNATPITAMMAHVGSITLFYSAFTEKERKLNGIQFEGDESIYPALVFDARTGDSEAEETTEVAQLGYVAPSLLEDKIHPAFAIMVPGKDYYRKGFTRTIDDHGNTFVVEPDGEAWYEQSADDGMMYEGPTDYVGYYPE